MSITDAKTIGSSDRDRENSTGLTRSERRREILRADPYYPHSLLRAVTMAAIIFLSMVGLAVLAVLLFWRREINGELLIYPAIYAVIFAGGQYLLRNFRVGRLEHWGRIPRRGAATENDPQG